MAVGSWKGNSEGVNGVWVLEGEWRGGIMGMNGNNGGEWDLGPGRCNERRAINASWIMGRLGADGEGEEPEVPPHLRHPWGGGRGGVQLCLRRHRPPAAALHLQGEPPNPRPRAT